MEGMKVVFDGPILEAQVLKGVLDENGLAAAIEADQRKARLSVPEAYADKADAVIQRVRKTFGGPADATIVDA